MEGTVNNLKKICLISNYNAYESKRYFTEKFAEALKRQGIEVLHVDAKESTLNAETISSIVRFKPQLTCSFNTLLPLSQNTFLWDYLETPHWSILVDPVAYSIESVNSRFSILSSVDKEDVEIIEAYPFKNTFFFPHAVEKEVIGTGIEDKIYDVVFLGSCYDYESLEVLYRDEYSQSINEVLHQASKLVLSDSSTSISHALWKTWLDAGLDNDSADFMAFFYFVDRYSRGRDRVDLIKAIKGVKVHVFGDFAEDEGIGMMGWKHYLSDCENVVLHPPVSFAESVEILKRTKIALNSMPFFKNGSHERVFYALACGALPLTTQTTYWQQEFIVDKEIATYQSGKKEEVNETVYRYLKDEALRHDVVQRGAEKVALYHTWDHRVTDVKSKLLPILNELS